MKLTIAQQNILDILKTENKAMSAYELLEKAKPYGFQAPIQIYRILKKLSEQCLIVKLNTLNMYVLNQAEISASYQLFTVCTECQRVQSIAIPQLKACVESTIQAKQFNPRYPYLEVVGQCFSCLSKHETQYI
ncbi:transcriptional repressor [Acinetobacter modestus]|uniref:transcriptional repressor n=1 Tax=Acinetobacter modestus TaxID=1776740 RepID=UPI001F4ACDF4|nr:transcriptional repressor [Acinetobacter modestus]MCH7388898.1 transcriptional repressor [Acinetobacter modestus]